MLRCEPAWVARDFLPPGRRLGLPEDQYDVGERGAICERWLASTTRADNRVGPAGRGAQLRRRRGRRAAAAARRRGRRPRRGAGRGVRRAPTRPGSAGWRRSSTTPTGCPTTSTRRRSSPSLVGVQRQGRVLPLPARRRPGRAPRDVLRRPPLDRRAAGPRRAAALPRRLGQRPDPAARPGRAPGRGRGLPRPLRCPARARAPRSRWSCRRTPTCWRCSRRSTPAGSSPRSCSSRTSGRRTARTHGERFPLRFVDWELNGDPWFYENRHLTPQPVDGSRRRRRRGDLGLLQHRQVRREAARRARRAARHRLREPGVYSVFVWCGHGHATPGSRCAAASRAATSWSSPTTPRPATTRSSTPGSDDLVVFTFFGPDLHPDAPDDPRRATMTDELPVGLVGAGLIAGVHAHAYRESPGVRLVAVADPVAGKAERLAEQHGAAGGARPRRAARPRASTSSTCARRRSTTPTPTIAALRGGPARVLREAAGAHPRRGATRGRRGRGGRRACSWSGHVSRFEPDHRRGPRRSSTSGDDRRGAA